MFFIYVKLRLKTPVDTWMLLVEMIPINLLLAVYFHSDLLRGRANLVNVILKSCWAVQQHENKSQQKKRPNDQPTRKIKLTKWHLKAIAKHPIKFGIKKKWEKTSISIFNNCSSLMCVCVPEVYDMMLFCHPLSLRVNTHTYLNHVLIDECIFRIHPNWHRFVYNNNEREKMYIYYHH